MAVGETAATAQNAYRLMLREHIAPALRELGFRRGPSLGAFRCETATHAAEVRFRKSRGSTTQQVDFWADMHASDIKTEFVYWERSLHSLAEELLLFWTLEAGRPVELVASEVLRVFRSYGWPAIQAALDNPGYPKDPAVRWPRTFPKIPRGPMFDDEIAAARRSRAELDEIMALADSDPRAFQALLARLATDPDPGVRQNAAWWLFYRASEERSRQALLAAAAEDEDVEVRWIARYAFQTRGPGDGHPGDLGHGRVRCVRWDGKPGLVGVTTGVRARTLAHRDAARLPRAIVVRP